MSVPRNILERRITRALRQPGVIRAAGGVIVTMTLLTVVAGGLLMRVFDRSEFPTIGDGLWWSLQTVTTVGYGDLVPKNTSGRLIAAVVMLQGIAFLTVVTAVITSIFIERARRENQELDDELAGQQHETMRSIDERLSRIEQRLDEL